MGSKPIKKLEFPDIDPTGLRVSGGKAALECISSKDCRDGA